MMFGDFSWIKFGVIFILCVGGLSVLLGFIFAKTGR